MRIHGDERDLPEGDQRDPPLPYWKRLPESYSLAGGETRTVSYTISSGIEESSTDTATTNISVGADVSAGWGPFSASVSAALSRSSTTTQQVTTSTQTTSVVTNEYTNPQGASPLMVIFWQLTDVITVFGSAGRPKSSVISGKQPPVVWGSHVDKLGPPHEVPSVAPEVLARVPPAPSLTDVPTDGTIDRG